MLDPGQAQAGSSTAITVYDGCTLEDAVAAATGHPGIAERPGKLAGSEEASETSAAPLGWPRFNGRETYTPAWMVPMCVHVHHVSMLTFSTVRLSRPRRESQRAREDCPLFLSTRYSPSRHAGHSFWLLLYPPPPLLFSLFLPSLQRPAGELRCALHSCLPVSWTSVSSNPMSSTASI